MSKPALFAVLLLILSSTGCADRDSVVRIATFNASMGLEEEGELARRLATGDDPGLRKLAEILQRVRPDVVLLNEIDYREDIDRADLLQASYLAVPQGGQQPIHYGHSFTGPVNTGVPSGLDIDMNGSTGDPADAWGFGHFPGQFGMLVLSRFPISSEQVRTFRTFLWHRMPGALRPLREDGADYYDDDTWKRLRLSSKSHWDIPIRLGKDNVIHLLASHPTPPVFDGPEDRNGTRNHDEIRFWADYISGDRDGYIVDDQGIQGGLGRGYNFVIAGDFNADAVDGDSIPGTVAQLLAHPAIEPSCTPVNEGGAQAAQAQGQANDRHQGDPAHDTADFSDGSTGNLRADYVLPSTGLEVLGCGIFWPAAGSDGDHLLDFTDHRLVWVDVRLQ